MAKRLCFVRYVIPKQCLQGKDPGGYTYSRRLGVVNIKSDSVISPTLNTKIEVS